MRGRKRKIPIENLNRDPRYIGALEVAALQVLKCYPYTILEKDELVSIGWMTTTCYQKPGTKFIWCHAKRQMAIACKKNQKSISISETEATEHFNEQQYMDNHDWLDVENHLKMFSERTKLVLRLRLNGLSLKEIGNLIAVSSARVGQIIKKAVASL